MVTAHVVGWCEGAPRRETLTSWGVREDFTEVICDFLKEWEFASREGKVSPGGRRAEERDQGLAFRDR